MPAPYGSRKDWVSIGTRVPPVLAKRIRKARRHLKANQRDFVGLALLKFCEIVERQP